MSSSLNKTYTEEPGNIHNSPNWTEQLNAFIDGELQADEQLQVEKHLQTCAVCQAEVELSKRLVTALNSLPEMSAPRSFAIRPEQARRLRANPVHTAAKAALAIAAALLIFVFTLDFSGVTKTAPENGITNANANATTSAVATPTPSLPPIGTLSACTDTNSGQGDVFCNSDPNDTVVPYTASPTRTVTPVPPISQVAASTNSAVHFLEIGLIILVLALAAFVIATRPRAPGRLRL